MPREWSCTLARGVFSFSFFHSPLTNQSPAVTEILRWMGGKKMKRAETLFPCSLFIYWVPRLAMNSLDSLLILLPPPLECWDYRYVPISYLIPTLVGLEKEYEE